MTKQACKKLPGVAALNQAFSNTFNLKRMPVCTTPNFRPWLSFAGLLFLISCTYSAWAGSEKPNISDNSLEFTENKNQWDKAVRFAANVPGGRMFLRSDGFTFSFVSLPDHHAAHKKTGKHPEKPKGHAYRVTFLNASAAVSTSGSKQAAGYSNYFIGNDQSNWASEVLSYRQVNYSGLYPGIGMQLYQYNKNLKYDFIVTPGADPAVIKMQYEGLDKITLEKGELHLKTSLNSVTELKPYAYQVINGKETEVPCRFRLEKNVVTFGFPKGYDKKHELIIDPELVFSTFTGSFADNWGFTATYDSVGNMYSGGIVFGPGYPVSPGAFDPTFNSTGNFCDIGIIKYNTAATGMATRIYATYLGGTQNDVPHSMVVNNNDELLVLGTTGASNFPVTANAYDNSFAGGPFISPLGFIGFLEYNQGSDLIISKFNSAGTALLSSTYLGGTANDGLLSLNHPLAKNYGDQFRGDITVDAADNVYITSSTSSLNFPVPNGFQTTFGGSLIGGITDAVVCKFNPTLSSLLWSSFLGGSGDDAAYSIQVDNAGNTLVAGGTNSSNFPGTAGGFRPTYSGNIDGFITKINNTGSSILQSTYMGTGSYDQTYFLQLDASANVYVLGQTQGNYPVAAAAGSSIFSVPNSGQFIHKLNPALTASIFSTTFGSGTGQINISPTAFLVDDCERIFVCGWGGINNDPFSMGSSNYVGGNTFNMPLSPVVSPHQSNTDGSDFYLIQLSQHAANLDYATYMGGSGGDHVDGGTSRFDKRGFVYQAVCGSCGGMSSNFPTTPGAWSNTNNSINCNNAAFKFDFQVSAAIAGSSQRVCANEPPFQITGATPAGGVWSGTGVSPTGLFTPAPGLVGTQILTYTVATGNCVSTSTKSVTVKAVPVVAFTGLDSAYCSNAAAATLTGSPAGGTFSGPGISGGSFNPLSAGPGNHTITYSYTAPDSCAVSVTKPVVVTEIAQAAAGPDLAVCTDAAPFMLTGATPAGGTWSGIGVSPAGLFTPSAGLTGAQTLTYTITNGNCSTTSQRTITVNPSPVASITGLDPDYCSNAGAVTLTGAPAGGTFSGPGITGNMFNPADAGSGNHIISYSFTSPDNCSASVSQTVSVTVIAQAAAGPDLSVCADAEPLQLTGASPTGGTWSGTGVSPGGLFTPSEAISGPQILSYTITSGNCTTTSQRIVTVNSNPPAVISGLAPEYCANAAAVTLSATPTGGTFSGPGITGNRFGPGEVGSGSHIVSYSYTSPDNCTTTTSQTVTVRGTTSIVASAPVPVCATDKSLSGLIPLKIQFSNSTAGTGSFLWDFNDGTGSAEKEPEHIFTRAGTFDITLTTDPGTPCAITTRVATIVTSETKNPNIITPNNDGKNETFQPLLTCFPATLEVFNRWGNKVYEQKNYDQSWNGKDLADGMYYYLLTDSAGQKWKGWVEILR